jgi:hypothetical protein
MRAADLVGIDLIQELRLRKWARENYVSPERRGSKWHPIVLEEMAFRDAELQAEGRVEPRSASTYVPLAPTEIQYVDDAHPAVPAPKAATQPQFVDAFVG